MESFTKRHPALTIIAVAGVLLFALGWWSKRQAAAAAASSAAVAAAPKGPLQKVADAVTSAKSWLATHWEGEALAVVFPPLVLLDPPIATHAYHDVRDFISNGGWNIPSLEHYAEGQFVPLTSAMLSKVQGDLPGIPQGAQIDNKGEITFDGTATGNYVAAWRSAGYEVYVDGNAITLKLAPAGSTTNPNLLLYPPAAPPPKAA